MTTPESAHAAAEAPRSLASGTSAGDAPATPLATDTPDASAQTHLAHDATDATEVTEATDASAASGAEARERWGLFGTVALMFSAFLIGGVYLYAYAIGQPFLEVLVRLLFPILVGYACLAFWIRPWKQRDAA